MIVNRFIVDILPAALNGEIGVGKLNVFANSDNPNYTMSLSWRHGFNRYVVYGLIDQRDIIVTDKQIVTDTLVDMLKLRDARIADVTFWTNCKDVE